MNESDEERELAELQASLRYWRKRAKQARWDEARRKKTIAELRAEEARLEAEYRRVLGLIRKARLNAGLGDGEAAEDAQ